MPGEDRDDLWSNQGPLELPPWFEGQAGEGKPNYPGMCGAPQYCNNSERESPTCAISGR